MNENKLTFSAVWNKAATVLKGNWCIAILAVLIHMVITGSLGQFKPWGGIINLLITPLTSGLMLFFLKLSRNESRDLGSLFAPFKDYPRMLWGNLRMTIFIILWSVLLIIPGIIAALRYSMTIYIMLDNPGLKAGEAMKQSCELVYGCKWKLFGYGILLSLLCITAGILTLGIALIWLVPFCNCFYANIYLALKNERPTAPANTVAAAEENQTPA
ncbi:MAG: DUF975 family protein [Lentisphaeria bacterium]|nr:DUF975 family protein [Lentisphaeria bacterium]